MLKRLPALLLVLLPMALPADADAPVAHAAMTGLEGESHGMVTLRQLPGGVLLEATLYGLPEGSLAFHVHEKGVCEPPFLSAGGHFNPAGVRHGLASPEGPHAGDMPNLHVPASGELKVEVYNTFVSLLPGAANGLLEGEGTSLVIHAGPDDHVTDPAGDAGPRIACGVIRRP
ncbi:MAG: superoxide dismutase family protein [Chromatiales bacterium]|nr:superoxide dismutase family protein [Chromatiales bacterium]